METIQNNKRRTPDRRLVQLALCLSLGLHLLILWLLPYRPVTAPENTVAHLPDMVVTLKFPTVKNLAVPPPIAPAHYNELEPPQLDSAPEPETLPRPVAASALRQPESDSESLDPVKIQTPVKTQTESPSRKAPDFSQSFPKQIARDKATGKISDAEWGFNPEVLEKLNGARQQAREFSEHREAVDQLNRHLLASSGKMVSAEDSHGVSYEKIGTPPALAVFALLGAAQTCYRVTRHSDGSRDRVRIPCDNMPVRWDQRDELFVHESLQPASREYRPQQKSFRETFIDQLSASNPVRPDTFEVDASPADGPAVSSEKPFAK